MVRLLLLFLILAGCAAQLSAPGVPPLPEPVPQSQAAAVGAEEEKESEKRKKATVKIILVPVPTPTITKPLPPCESDAGDKRTAILQKLECLKQTADIPVVVKPKP